MTPCSLSRVASSSVLRTSSTSLLYFLFFSFYSFLEHWCQVPPYSQLSRYPASSRQLCPCCRYWFSHCIYLFIPMFISSSRSMTISLFRSLRPLFLSAMLAVATTLPTISYVLFICNLCHS